MTEQFNMELRWKILRYLTFYAEFQKRNRTQKNVLKSGWDSENVIKYDTFEDEF